MIASLQWASLRDEKGEIVGLLNRPWLKKQLNDASIDVEFQDIRLIRCKEAGTKI